MANNMTINMAVIGIIAKHSQNLNQQSVNTEQKKVSLVKVMIKTKLDYNKKTEDDRGGGPESPLKG